MRRLWQRLLRLISRVEDILAVKAEGRIVEVAIKPCPFCGSKEVKLVDIAGRYQPGAGARWIVECVYCGVYGGRSSESEEAIRLWNKRAGDVW